MLIIRGHRDFVAGDLTISRYSPVMLISLKCGKEVSAAENPEHAAVIIRAFALFSCQSVGCGRAAAFVVALSGMFRTVLRSLASTEERKEERKKKLGNDDCRNLPWSRGGHTYNYTRVGRW